MDELVQTQPTQTQPTQDDVVSATALQEQLDAVRAETFTTGVLQKIQYDEAHNEMLKYMALKRIKEQKQYKACGMSWAAYCESVGMVRKTVDRVLDDMEPVVQNFSDNLSALTGMDFQKIRLLGRAVNQSENKDGKLCIGDKEIEISAENASEIISQFEAMNKEKRDVQDQSEARKRRIAKMDKSLAQYEQKIASLERETKEKGYQPGEAEFFKKMEKLRATFDGLAIALDPENDPLPEKPTSKMRAAYAGLLKYVEETINGYAESILGGDFDFSEDYID